MSRGIRNSRTIVTYFLYHLANYLIQSTPGLQGIPVSVKMVQPSDNFDPFFDIDTGRFKATLPGISPGRIQPIAAYKKNGKDFVIFRWLDGSNLRN